MSDSHELPERADPRRLAATGGTVTGTVPIAELSRLVDRLAAEDGSGAGRATLHMRFDEDAQRRIRITGRIEAKLTLQCQRCLQPFEWAADRALNLVAVADEDAAAGVPRDWEPVIVPPQGLDPATLIEDELILALPLAARCERPECLRTSEDAKTERRRNNPFAALANLDLE